jgi:hypothetical protein
LNVLPAAVSEETSGALSGLEAELLSYEEAIADTGTALIAVVRRVVAGVRPKRAKLRSAAVHPANEEIAGALYPGLGKILRPSTHHAVRGQANP